MPGGGEVDLSSEEVEVDHLGTVLVQDPVVVEEEAVVSLLPASHLAQPGLGAAGFV